MGPWATRWNDRKSQGVGLLYWGSIPVELIQALRSGKKEHILYIYIYILDRKARVPAECRDWPRDHFLPASQEKQPQLHSPPSQGRAHQRADLYLPRVVEPLRVYMSEEASLGIPESESAFIFSRYIYASSSFKIKVHLYMLVAQDLAIVAVFRIKSRWDFLIVNYNFVRKMVRWYPINDKRPHNAQLADPSLCSSISPWTVVNITRNNRWIWRPFSPPHRLTDWDYDDYDSFQVMDILGNNMI